MSATPAMKQIPLPIGTAPGASLDNFVPGANVAALHHLRQLARAGTTPTTPAAPVYLWGPAGCGKTHLLRALADAHGVGATWFDAASPLPGSLEAAATLVLIDDCQALDAERQHAAFTLFVEATGAGVPVAAAGRAPPVDLPLRDDLRTRLGWGLVHALQPLTDAEARTALRRHAQQRGIGLGDEVIDYLLTRFSRDMKHLMHWLDRLDDYAWVERRGGITLPLLRRVLADADEAPR